MEDSTAALVQVAHLSRELGAEVHLLHAADDISRFGHHYGDADPKMLADLQRRELEAAGIVATAREVGADLIVMSSRGLDQDREDRGLFGSVANQVLQSSPVPVMVVRPDAWTGATQRPI